MKKSRFVLFVSEKLKSYYESLSKTRFDNKTYLMPCFNESLSLDAILRKDYSRKSFAYVGSLDLWQCFDKTIELFKFIQKKYPGSSFKVLTFQCELAIELLEKNGILNYEVKSVPKEMVKKELMDVSYGFIIRDNIEMNRVATPTKFSSYLSVGVLPIYSSCLADFAKVARGLNISYCLDGDSTSGLVNFISSPKDNAMIAKSISFVFSSYYDRFKHIDELTKRMKNNL